MKRLCIILCLVLIPLCSGCGDFLFHFYFIPPPERQK